MANAREYSVLAAQYAKDVISGKIAACKWIRLACQRHLDNLDWQDDDTYKYRFDEDAGIKACRFIELMPHTKGKWAAQRLKLVMESWQVFMTMCFFGWKRKRDNTRRFRKLFLLVPRKNGKSAWAAAVGLYFLVADGEFGAEVFSGATKEKQAWEVFKPARLMALKSPDLLSHYGVQVNASNIHVITDSAKFEPLIGNPSDGASPSCAIVDEYHEHDTDKLFDTMETGMGAREQPAMIVITTAGDNISGPCYSMQDQAQKVLEGAKEDDELFALIYTIDTGDDWTDQDVLKKANPNWGVSVGDEFLKSRQKDAIQNARKSGVFKTKHLNVWVQARDAYYDLELHNKNADKTLSLDDFEGKECIIGLDLAEKKDLAAVSLVFRDGLTYHRFGNVYLPNGTIEQPENEHFRGWRDEGLLIETDGNVTDFNVIYDDILGLMERFHIREIAFDPWHAQQLVNDLIEQGAPCIQFGNRPSLMNEPMRELDAAITDGRWIHDGNLCYDWQLSNVVNGTRKGDLHRPDKEKAENKIDSPVADMMALGRWMMDKAAPSSPWDDEEYVLEAS
tara:strand:- start:2040 stop:3728 length:1689 start_codon:yes stop_codon:yes gene_type:complete